MVSELKVNKEEEQRRADWSSPPAYDDVVQQRDKYPFIDSRFSPPITNVIPQYKRPRLGRDPIQALCHLCRMHITTLVDFRTSFLTHAMATSVACIGFWPIAWVPYVFDVFKTANHYCPHCNAYIGKE